MKGVNDFEGNRKALDVLLSDEVLGFSSLAE